MAKILIYDIETAPMIAAVWGLFGQDIHYESILEDWYIISAAWKWYDKKKIDSVSVIDSPKRFNKNHKDDFEVVKRLHEILTEADILIAHNGDRFDLKKFNARALYHGLPPIPSKPSIDTLKVARKHFKLTSNRLDYIGQHLGVGKKIDTPKGLWLDVIKGSEDAVKKMVKYNKGDITLLEAVYEKLRPYMDNHPNLNVIDYGEHDKCPQCGSYNLKKQGFKYTRVAKRQMYQCGDCGGWSYSKRNVKIIDIR